MRGSGFPHSSYVEKLCKMLMALEHDIVYSEFTQQSCLIFPLNLLYFEQLKRILSYLF